MGDPPYISPKQGGLIIHSGLIYEYTIYKLYKTLRAEAGGLIHVIHHGLIILIIRYMYKAVMKTELMMKVLQHQLTYLWTLATGHWQWAPGSGGWPGSC